MSGTVTDQLTAALGARVVAMSPVSGGSICDSYHARLADGRDVFVKSHARAADMFELEAAGLMWLREAEAVPVPEVLAASRDILVLEYVPAGRSGASSGQAELGRALAALHRSGAAGWGWHHPANLATVPLSNEPTATWSEFYGRRRLIPLARMCRAKGVIDAAAVTSTEALADRLPDLVGPSEPPSRLHGDLWGGNVLWAEDGRAWLVDPSCYGGHREVDLAMLRLFGSPGAPFWDAYAETWPLAEGWQERVRLYQLLPLMVHALLFGGGYVGSALAVLAEYSA